jgi:phospholipase/lecithinase/hemolysin
VLTQVATFVGLLGGADPDALYVVFGGNNDVFAALQNPPAAQAIITGALGSLAEALDALVGEGATTVLIPNLPNIGLAPGIQAQGPAAVTLATQLSGTFNTGLALIVAARSLNPAVDLRILDTFSIASEIVDDAMAGGTRFGITNWTLPCLTGVSLCAAPESYLFWDISHPTTAAHAVLAQRAAEAVPEPTTVMLLGLGLAGLRLVSQRRSRR